MKLAIRINAASIEGELPLMPLGLGAVAHVTPSAPHNRVSDFRQDRPCLATRADAIDALARIGLETDLWWMWVAALPGMPGPAIPVPEVYESDSLAPLIEWYRANDEFKRVQM